MSKTGKFSGSGWRGAMRQLYRLMIPCLGMALLGPLAYAESECAQNYRADPSAKEATLHTTFVGLYGADITTAAARLKEKGAVEKWILVKEMNVNDMTDEDLYVMFFGQEATEKARAIFPIIIQLAQETDSVILSVELPKGMIMPTVKNEFCSFLASAGLSGQPANASRAHAGRNFAYVSELMAALRGDFSQMNKRGEQNMAKAKAGRQGADVSPGAFPQDAQDRGAPPPVADRREVVKPGVAFNPKDVDPARLQEGRSTISGLICVRGGASDYALNNRKIALFPYTPYLQEAINLIDNNRKKSANEIRLDIDPRAFVVHLEGRTNAEGKFQFSRIKPGRYLLLVRYADSYGVEVNRSVGSVEGYGGSYDVKRREVQAVSRDEILQADVTVDKDGDVVDGVVVKQTNELIPVLDVVCKMHAK